jgi:hypothetical protein
MKLNGTPVDFTAGNVPVNIVLHFRHVSLAINFVENASPHTVLMKDPLVQYYLNQTGRGSPNGGIGPIYAVQTFIQRGHGIGSF